MPEVFEKPITKGRSNDENRLIEFILSGGSFNYESSFEESEFGKSPKKIQSKIFFEEDKNITKLNDERSKKVEKLNIKFRTKNEFHDSFSDNSNMNESFLQKIYENNESSEEDHESKISITYNLSDSILKDGASKGKMKYSIKGLAKKRKASH